MASVSSHLEKRAFVWLLLGLLAGALYVIHPFFYVVSLSVILVVLFNPLHRKFFRWTRGRENLSAVFSVLSVLLLIIIPMGVLFTFLTAEVANFIQYVSNNGETTSVSGLLSHWQDLLSPVMEKIEQWFGIRVNWANLAKQSAQGLGKIFAQYSPSVVAGTANFFFQLFIMLLLVFYLFRDGSLIFEKLLKISPVKDKYERNLAREIENTIQGVFYGTFLTGLIQAILATLGYWIAGVPSPLLWGFLTFFVSFIPLVGTSAVLVPMVLYLLIHGSYGYALFLGVYGVVIIGSSDNLLKPLLIRSNVHQALLFLGIFGGLAVFGALGLLLGPILMAMLTATLRIYEKDYLLQK